MAEARKFRVNLTDKDSQDLKKMADDLGLTESDVIRKGLQLMALYSQTRQSDGDAALIYRKEDTDQELRLV